MRAFSIALLLACIFGAICLSRPGFAAEEAQARPVIAVLELGALNTSAADTAVVSNFVRQAVVENGSFDVVDKGSMERILAEQAFQQTGCTDQECAVRLGKILNAERIVVGSFSVLGSVHYLTAQLVDVATGRIVQTAKEKGFTKENVDEAAERLVAQLLGGEVPSEKGGTSRRPKETKESIAGKSRKTIDIDVILLGGVFGGKDHAYLSYENKRVIGGAARLWKGILGAELRFESISFREISEYSYWTGYPYPYVVTVTTERNVSYSRLSCGIRLRHQIGRFSPSIGVAYAAPMGRDWETPDAEKLMLGGEIAVEFGRHIIGVIDFRSNALSEKYLPRSHDPFPNWQYRYDPFTVALGARF